MWEEGSAAEEATRSTRAGGSETVLLVEDEEIVRSLVREMLGRAATACSRRRTARRRWRVFTSGYTEDAIANHGVLSPGTAFVEKPFTAAQLAQKLRAVLDA